MEKQSMCIVIVDSAGYAVYARWLEMSMQNQCQAVSFIDASLSLN